MGQGYASADEKTADRKLPPDWPLIPGYEILDELGRGGMGVVFRARQSATKKLVALKVIRDGALASPQDRARFRLEAEAAASVQHPGVVQILEVGEHAGHPFFAMELVRGGSLDQLVATRPQPARQSAQLVKELALAVEHAHQQNVIHRDLKPANILLQIPAAAHQKSTVEISPPADDFFTSLHPKIADFGLAKRLDSQSTAWTQAGAVLGTASYMAPEQAAGRVLEIGPAVDIYALGAMLYELLTGRPPFRGDSWQHTLQQVLHDDPLPPSQHTAAVPRDLEMICLKCLEKEPARRYATAGDLAADLDRFLTGAPVAAAPLDEQERLFRLAQRDGYQILGEVGRGPRSTIYRALFGPLQQQLALKVFHSGTGTRDEWETRQRQYSIQWSAVTHPHVIPVLRSGWWDGAPYVAQEYVSSGTLASRLTRKPYPVAQALRLLEALGEIICYVHRQGVVHGNLKPSNILLAADGIPRIADFHTSGGLFLKPPQELEELTGIGYVAPELVDNPDAEPRPYTDVYGLGVILYELLAARPPFDGETVLETLEQVRTHDPPPIAPLNSNVSPDLEAFCRRSLQKNPWRRFHRAYDWLSHLRYFKNLQDR